MIGLLHPPKMQMTCFLETIYCDALTHSYVTRVLIVTCCDDGGGAVAFSGGLTEEVPLSDFVLGTVACRPWTVTHSGGLTEEVPLSDFVLGY